MLVEFKRRINDLHRELMCEKDKIMMLHREIGNLQGRLSQYENPLADPPNAATPAQYPPCAGPKSEAAALPAPAILISISTDGFPSIYPCSNIRISAPQNQNK